MLNRVTNQTMMAAAQRNLQATMSRSAELQDQASSQKKISKPSDDPAAAGDALRLRNELRAADQYGRNIDNGIGWASRGDSVLGNVTDILNRVRDLTVQGANDGAKSPAGKESIAAELEGLKADLMVQSNAQYIGRNLFAGNSDASAAFNPDYSWNGATGSTVARRLGPTETLRVDVDGSKVFGDGGGSAFAMIDNIISDLRTGTNISDHLNSIDDRLQAVVGQRSELGLRQARLEKAAEMNLASRHSLEASRAGVEDIDMAEIILEMNLHEINYQAALASTAKVLQPTLMDFLR